jgi:hypothetical protein
MIKRLSVVLSLAVVISGCTITVNPRPAPTVIAINSITSGTSTRLLAYAIGRNDPSSSVSWRIVDGGGFLSSQNGTSVIYTAPLVTGETKIRLGYLSNVDSSIAGQMVLTVKPVTVQAMSPEKPATDTAITTMQSLPVSPAIQTNPAEQAWIQQFGTSQPETGFAMALDSSGNSIVVGTTNGPMTGNPSFGESDVFVTKLDPSGARVWTIQIGSDQDDDAAGVTTAANGDILVSGTTGGDLLGQKNAGKKDAFVMRVNPNGKLAWLALIGTPRNDSGGNVVVDADGNAYVAGSTNLVTDNTSGDSANGWITKFLPNGTRTWIHQFGPPQGEVLRENPPGVSVTGIALDGQNGVYTVGTVKGLGALRGGSLENLLDLSDAFIARFDAEGKQLWFKRIGTTAIDVFPNVSSDAKGMAFVSGQTAGSFDKNEGGFSDAFVAKVNPNGTVAWAHNVGSTGIDVVRSAPLIAANGDVFLVGNTTGAMRTIWDDTKSSTPPVDSSDLTRVLLAFNPLGGEVDSFVMKLTADGSRQWAWQFGTEKADGGFGGALDGAGHVFVAGATSGSFNQANIGRGDVFVGKFPLSALEQSMR